jgi:hypothetical protein
MLAQTQDAVERNSRQVAGAVIDRDAIDDISRDEAGFGSILHYPPINTIVREGGAKSGALMRCPSSFSITTKRI